ncbi:MAG: hypothetical protein IJF40_05005 [Clostridia bacterium]|nr:hypothetical protein [Clostridia bacterium]
MSNQNNLTPEELMRLAANLKTSNKNDPNALAKLLSNRLTPEKKQQFNNIINDKEAMQRLLQSKEAQQLMKKFGGTQEK